MVDKKNNKIINFFKENKDLLILWAAFLIGIIVLIITSFDFVYYLTLAATLISIYVITISMYTSTKLVNNSSEKQLQILTSKFDALTKIISDEIGVVKEIKNLISEHFKPHLKEKRIPIVNTDFVVNPRDKKSFNFDVPQSATGAYIDGLFNVVSGGNRDIILSIIRVGAGEIYRNINPTTEVFNRALGNGGNKYMVEFQNIAIFTSKKVNANISMVYYVEE